MTPLPHRYVVTAFPGPAHDVALSSPGVRPLTTAAPVEFDGPGGLWSPETLLVGAVADCFAITFRGVARASQLEWIDMSCEVTGTLDRIDGVMRFTQVDLHARLTLPDTAGEALAGRVLDKAKRTCLITNSLTADVHLHTSIETRSTAGDACPR
jgi:organic hydroperoxide reductase OsmC/OhrA